MSKKEKTEMEKVYIDTKTYDQPVIVKRYEYSEKGRKKYSARPKGGK